MPGSTSPILIRLGRWPRRIAALVCLLLAAGTAVAPHGGTRAVPKPAGLAARLHTGEVALAVPISSPDGVRYVHPGDRVGVLAGPPDDPVVGLSAASSAGAVLVADRLRVMSVADSADALADDSSATVLVAASRTDAIHLARYASAALLLIIDGVP